MEEKGFPWTRSPSINLLRRVPNFDCMKTGFLPLSSWLLILCILVSGCSTTVSKENPLSSGINKTSDIRVGNWQYTFSDVRGNADRPLLVFTYRPAAWNTSCPILIIMGGSGELDAWIPYGERYSALIVAPEFPHQYYPNDDWFHLGNMINGIGSLNNRSHWTLMAIEHLFDDVRSRTGAKQDTYLLYGFSAGGQFVHRLVTFLPDARYTRAVAGSPGVYVMPNYSIPFPFGLKGSPLSESDLTRVFSRKLIIMSGDEDTNPNDPSLAKFPLAEAEGSTRFERAKNYFETAQKEANLLHVPLNWEYHVVPGVGHNDIGMIGPSAERLFTST
jgi:pimeloyl-ACP methyl ester carboxylesterase